MKHVVLDASIALSWLLPGEETRLTLPLRDRAAENLQLDLIVPPIFWYEVGNALWVAVRRYRIAQSDAVKALESLMEFQLSVWVAEPMSCLSLSLEHNIAVYDAAYLSLAMDKDSILWSIDKALRNVAESLGVHVEPGQA